MVKQKIITSYTQFDEILRPYSTILLVCGGSIKYLEINNYFNSLKERLGVEVIRFSDFHPNPTYDSVVRGVDAYHLNTCQAIIAVGGGSAMDVAKCIKLYSTMSSDACYLKQKVVPNSIPLFAVPTTAGTGSESTRFAVIYYKGEKQSVHDISIVPSVVLMDASVLKSLPLFQKKVTMLDAFCHSIESYWSVNSTDESKVYSEMAIRLIMSNYIGYLENTDIGNKKMLEASNYAGKAINITQTTAGHAMSYKLTSLYNIPHGYACALAVSVLWPYMNKNLDKTIDIRGKEYLYRALTEIAESMGFTTSEEGASRFASFLKELDLPDIKINANSDYDDLVDSVNTVRLKNHPIALTRDIIRELYKKIVK